ncbi:MAG: hypothetical protein K1X82_12265, partial [Bacteroidia bacterium]|nr:hypothetical protein [Bacteroidia bacterium]
MGQLIKARLLSYPRIGLYRSQTDFSVVQVANLNQREGAVVTCLAKLVIGLSFFYRSAAALSPKAIYSQCTTLSFLN